LKVTRQESSKLTVNGLRGSWELVTLAVQRNAERRHEELKLNSQPSAPETCDTGFPGPTQLALISCRC